MADLAGTNGTSGFVDDESDEDASQAQAQIIVSLRAQVTDLFSQVTQLNSKLVSSYDRVSDLEDQLHDTSSSLRNASVTISSLELERSHHLAALNTGLLVEKAHVTAELNRLMERATEEAAQRGQAETARHDIEKDLDDLSATLFDQANTMVAEARLNQAKSERKVRDAEQALKIAEDAVKDMQVQMQSLQAEKEAAERDTHEANLTMRKGKWVERDDVHVGEVPRIRFTITHTPYTEFIAFVVYLRGLRVSQPTPPVISTLLSQPFIARLLTEDSEPTVRLDLAPSLNWLSRRSVLAAIHTGMLTVEPVSFQSLVLELHQHPQSMTASTLSCALCGTLIARLPSTTPASRSHNTNGNSWFKYPLALGSAQHHRAGAPQPERELPEQVYIFRLAAPTVSSPPPALIPMHTSSMSVSVGTSSRPPLNGISSSRVLQAQTQNSPYPLCTSHYCLTRLRSTCSLWAFVRAGIVERIWEEGVVQPPKTLVNHDFREKHPPLTISSADGQPTSGAAFPSASEKPPIPPRRRRLWEMASALGERAVSWGKEGGDNSKDRDKEAEKGSAKDLPTAPPSHPSAPHPHAESSTSREHAPDPPPLPKRNAVRGRATMDAVVPPSDAQNGIAVPGTKESAINASGHDDPDKTSRSASDSSLAPIDEITPTAPPSEVPLPQSTRSHPAATGSSVPPVQDPLPPASPHTIPLPITPTTPNPISRVTSPVLRPRSRLSSPASPPPSSRPASPAVSRSHAGSPAPPGTTRATSPSLGRAPSVSHIRGKMSMPSPLASSRPASPAPTAGPGAPPLPRRAAARRVMPPPPTSADPKFTEEGGKEGVLSVATAAAADPTPEVDASKTGEVEVPAETKSSESEGEGEGEADVVKEISVSQDASVPTPTMEADPGPAEGVDSAQGNVEVGVNYASTTVVPDPLSLRASEGDSRASVDTASTKQSSSTEGENFASDTTWEERTWKELVRLKEDMFWARTGGVRAFQE